MITLNKLIFSDTPVDGFVTPSISFQLEGAAGHVFNPVAAAIIETLLMEDEKLYDYDPLPEFEILGAAKAGSQTAKLLQWTFLAQKIGLWPTFQTGAFVPADPESDDVLGAYRIPTRQNAPNLPAQFLMFVLNQGLLLSADALNEQRFTNGLKRTAGLVAEAGMGGVNQRPLLAELIRRDVPVNELSKTIYQAGLGPRARLVRGSGSNRTPTLAKQVANDKWSTLEILKTMDIPVTDSHQVWSDEDAIKKAAEIGYPVVLKTNFGNFGRGLAVEDGVFPNIVDEDALRQVLIRTDFDAEVYILEKHFRGDPARVCIYDGQPILVQVNPRPFIVGDGKSSVHDLILDVCAFECVEEFRYATATEPSETLESEEVLACLKQQKLTLEDCLPKGKRAFLLQRADWKHGTVSEFQPPTYMSAKIREIVQTISSALDLTEISVDFIGDPLNAEDPDVRICEININPAYMSRPEKKYIGVLAEAIAQSIAASD